MRSLLLTIFILLFTFTNGQTWFDVTKDYPCQGCVTTPGLDNLTPYNPSVIQKVFNHISNAGITFSYPQGGCQQRAEIMSMMLTKKYKIAHCKIWLFAPVDLYRNNDTTLFIKDKNNLTPDGNIRWNYHVAPCVVIEGKNRKDTIVIDPSLDASKPLPLAKWFALIGNSSSAKYTFLDPKWYFFNTQDNGASTVINGYFYTNTATTYCNDSYKDLTLEKGLSVNDMAIYILNKYIQTLRAMKVPSAAQTKMLNDLKSVWGNVNTLENLFSLFKSGCGDNATLRHVLGVMASYPVVMADAISFYHKRLLYWMGETEKLNQQP